MIVTLVSVQLVWSSGDIPANPFLLMAAVSIMSDSWDVGYYNVVCPAGTWGAGCWPSNHNNHIVKTVLSALIRGCHIVQLI